MLVFTLNVAPSYGQALIAGKMKNHWAVSADGLKLFVLKTVFFIRFILSKTKLISAFVPGIPAEADVW